MDVSGMRGKLKICDDEDVTSAADPISEKIVARHRGWMGEFGEIHIHFIVSVVVRAETEILISHNTGCGFAWHTKSSLN